MAEKMSMKMEETMQNMGMEKMTEQRETVREAAKVHLYELREKNVEKEVYATWRRLLAYQNGVQSLLQVRREKGEAGLSKAEQF